MTTQKKMGREKRRPVLCANCETQMVGMNKYIILKDNKELYVWHVCPRRKKSGENGCGHKIPVEIEKNRGSEEAGSILGSRLLGEVRSSKGITMLIQDNFETFNTWLHNNREKFKSKRVEITIRTIEKEGG